MTSHGAAPSYEAVPDYQPLELIDAQFGFYGEDVILIQCDSFVSTPSNETLPDTTLSWEDAMIIDLTSSL
ncbi:hypothetical protein HN51_052583 [Arachis hypogaea]